MGPTLAAAELTAGELTVGEQAVAAGIAGGMVGGLLAGLGIFLLIWAILGIIAGWKIFEKAGEPGWKILIPFYDLYIFCKIVGMKMWFWISLLVAIVGGIIMAATGFDPNTMNADSFSGNTLFPALVYVAEMIFALVISIMFYWRLSKVFGHGVGFTIGLFFLSGIFLMILGFGKSKYDKKVAKTLGVE